jgi:hypothetical protein
MKVWLVGTCDVEMTYVQHVCLSEKTALKRWNELRQNLIKEYQGQIDYMNEKKETIGIGKYERMIKRLSETDPKTLDNYPQEEPFITEMETEE